MAVKIKEKIGKCHIRLRLHLSGKGEREGVAKPCALFSLHGGRMVRSAKGSAVLPRRYPDPMPSELAG